MRLTYKYRLKDRSASKRLRAMAVGCNQIWNYCNAYQKDAEARYRAGAPKRRWPTNYDLQKLTTGTSRDLGIHADAIGRVCARYAQSRDKARHSLRFRVSLGSKRSLGWVPFKPLNVKVDGNGVRYLGLTYRWFGNKRRPMPSVHKGGAFVEDARGRWWVTFVVEVDALATGAGEVGIDLGLKALATLSSGEAVPALQHYRQYEQRLAVASRAGNKRRVRAIHAKIANVRRDHLHKATTQIARENALMAVGNVSSSQLVKTRMAKSILDVSWSIFRAQLRYKASRHGAVYLDVDERFTTQVCSACGCNPASSPKGMGALGIRSWTCCECGETHDRDVNAARNILRIGRSIAPPVEESRRAAA